jgi:hypothetical protein
MMKTAVGNKMASASRAAYRFFIGPVHKDKIMLRRDVATDCV